MKPAAVIHARRSTHPDWPIAGAAGDPWAPAAGTAGAGASTVQAFNFQERLQAPLAAKGRTHPSGCRPLRRLVVATVITARGELGSAS